MVGCVRVCARGAVNVRLDYIKQGAINQQPSAKITQMGAFLSAAAPESFRNGGVGL